MNNEIIETYKSLWEKVKTSHTAEEKNRIIGQLNELVAENEEVLAPVFNEIAASAIANAQNLLYREKFKYLSETLSMANVARVYFGKSTAWISQKINGHIKNGKACAFTPDELRKLKVALKDISSRLSDIADNL